METGYADSGSGDSDVARIGNIKDCGSGPARYSAVRVFTEDDTRVGRPGIDGRENSAIRAEGKSAAGSPDLDDLGLTCVVDEGRLGLHRRGVVGADRRQIRDCGLVVGVIVCLIDHGGGADRGRIAKVGDVPWSIGTTA